MRKVKGKSKKSKLQFKSQNFKFYLVVLPFTFCLLTFLALFPIVAMACPMCKESLFDPGQLPQKLSTARGYALSIGLMLAVPAALIAGVTMLVVRAARRAKHFPQP